MVIPLIGARVFYVLVYIRGSMRPILSKLSLSGEAACHFTGPSPRGLMQIAIRRRDGFSPLRRRKCRCLTS
jgi:hypothetical protein